jgi:L-lactate dehydrogenase
MKVSIIGGGGLVGSCTGFALQAGKVVREIVLIDANAEMGDGQALDLMHGAALMADQTIRGGGYDQVPTSDVICITAGLRRKPDESRLDLINRNTDLFLGILNEVAKSGYKKDAIVLVVSNPVDVLTYLAIKKLDLPPAQVIGLGTQLDTLRFRSLIAAKLNAAPTQVSALILGEHGDSMVPIWSSAAIAGLPLERYPGWSMNLQNELFTRTKGSGAEVIKKKGGAGFAVGVAIADVIHAIALDRRSVLPISSLQTGCYGLRDVAISVPTVVGRHGVIDTHEIELWPKELQSLKRSGQVLRETIDTVLERVGKDLCACGGGNSKKPCGCKH